LSSPEPIGLIIQNLDLPHADIHIVQRLNNMFVLKLLFGVIYFSANASRFDFRLISPAHAPLIRVYKNSRFIFHPGNLLRNCYFELPEKP
jgi:hypothetical protein